MDLENDLEELSELIDVTNESDNKFISEINKKTLNLLDRVKEKEFENFLSGEADPNSCFLEVHSGAGGLEAQDWAEMISRMYIRWSEKKKIRLRDY